MEGAGDHEESLSLRVGVSTIGDICRYLRQGPPLQMLLFSTGEYVSVSSHKLGDTLTNRCIFQRLIARLPPSTGKRGVSGKRS